MRRIAVFTIAAAVLALLAAPAMFAAPNVTLTWWHNGSADPLLTLWQQVADQYHAEHPNVTINVEPIQNEQFTTKIPLALQSNDPPDIYQQWGGGQLATQVKSGKVADITRLVAPWIKELGGSVKGWQVGGRQYGIPYDLHVVGFWYRKDLFAKAGIDGAPRTLAELNADVAKLKAAGIAPISIGSKDRWPDAFWWEYFVLREVPPATLAKAMETEDFSAPSFLKAGDDLKAFLATSPFQDGFLGTPAQQGAGSSAGLVANGQAAMELQGDWETSVMAALSTDPDLKSKLGWFPFPAINGGGGDQTAMLGGGDGFSVTTRNAAAGADFLKFISSTGVQTRLVKAGVASIPANPAAKSAITDPNVKDISSYVGKASFVQTYFDIALPTDAGQALDSAVADYFGGEGGPDAIPASVTAFSRKQ